MKFEFYFSKFFYTGILRATQSSSLAWEGRLRDDLKERLRLRQPKNNTTQTNKRDPDNKPDPD